MGETPEQTGAIDEARDIGRSSRRVPQPMRDAVVARDLVCSHPSCDEERPAKLEMHHIVPWHKGGETRLENLTVLCREHHRLHHFSEWEMQMILGTPMCIPPSYIDKERKPRANLLNRMPTTHPHLWSEQAVQLFMRLDENLRRRRNQQQ